ncbi:peptidase M1 [Lewinellaceae bacterium SD302]|nr:peptidase M1 [Lewinellaceae bacterium SD302]
MRNYSLLLLFSLACCSGLSAQHGYWQQAIKYQMDIEVDVEKNQYAGQQRVNYTNNSPDTLNKVFYHLYFNAFKPGSMMDERTKAISDVDPRMGSRIGNLKPDEIGYIKVNSLTQDNQPVKYNEEGTILVVELNKPILPGQTTEFVMGWDAQVPLQIRRSGRDNKEGVRFSMSQWYPKLAEYDVEGWHANPYIAREFHGVWGDFDVRITIDRDYVIGATGYLQNPKEIGYGYADEPKRRKKMITYHYLAPNVHDFVWAADPDYTHDTFERADGTTMHFFYQKNEKTEENWAMLPKVMDEAFNFINKNYGQYPYKQYSFIQGGDGGMEYPMATLITGERPFMSLVGVSVHELMHSWYQMYLGTNEALYAWMDEGFTSWASSEVMNHLKKEKLIPGDVVENPHARSYSGLRGFRTSGMQEPLSVHADHFNTNAAYSVAAYVNGAVFLEQLRYVIGEGAFKRTMLRYYNTWGGKHPTPRDFIRIAEKESGLELDWYKEYWVYTTKMADYAITDVIDEGETTAITLTKKGEMPMPLEVKITTKDGKVNWYYIPIRIMRGEKPQPAYAENWTVLEDWPWTNPTYKIMLPVENNDIEKVEIDPRGRMYDDVLEDNVR